MKHLEIKLCRVVSNVYIDYKVQSDLKIHASTEVSSRGPGDDFEEVAGKW
jgi:hypothetical protein